MNDAFTINLAGDIVPVAVRQNSRAKRLILRVDKATGSITLTMPARASWRSAERFITDHVGWLLTERARVQRVDPLGCGDCLPLLGETVPLFFSGSAPRSVRLEDDKILVGGPRDMAGKRLENWLKKKARDVLTERAAHYALKLGVEYSRISIGDMKSRWGSCSETGTLRFNWRLVMAPFEVLDYVAAHEVAHLREMNHSDRFWAHVAFCVPEHKKWRHWLKKQGSALFAIRFEQGDPS